MTSLSSESIAMRIAGLLRLRRMRWSLRRLYVPVNRSALVLEVGAGGNPYPRANVLLDGFEVSDERLENRLVTDRPFVLGLCEKLPFRDKVFDFVIASHVLEHTDDPATFLSELQRVAKAGYIETPDAFFERINPFTYHRLEVTAEKQRLVIKKKPYWIVDPEVVGLYEKNLKNDPAFQHFIRNFPDSLYLRYYWSDRIEYSIMNVTEDADWDYPPEMKSRSQTTNKAKELLRSLYRLVRRKAFSQNCRNSRLDVMEMLRCIKCDGTELRESTNALLCMNCHQEYSIENGVPRMILDDLPGANRVRFESTELSKST